MQAWTSHPVAVHVTENHNPKENEHQTRIDRPSQRCTKPSGGRGTGGAHQSRERQEKKKTAETGAPCRSQRRQWNFLSLLDARRSSEYICTREPTAKKCSLAVSGYRRVAKRRGPTSIKCSLLLMFTDCTPICCSVMSPGSINPMSMGASTHQTILQTAPKSNVFMNQALNLKPDSRIQHSIRTSVIH